MEFVFPRRSAAYLGILLAGSIVAVSVSVFLNAQAQRLETESHGWIEHTYEVKLLLTDTLKRVIDLETGARGYALTMEDEFLEPMLTAEDRLQGLGVALKAEVADNAGQVRRAEQVLELIRQRILHAQGMVTLARDRVSSVEMAAYARGGKLLTDHIRALVAEMVSVEEGLLAQRSAAHAHDVITSHRLAWLLVAMQGVLWAALLVVVRRAIRAEAFVTICSWSKTICYHNEWITFDEYLRRRFGVKISHGISPAETEKFLRTLPVTPAKPVQDSSLG